ncbi:MAG: hypothetical protein AB2807_05975 [Candidatus Sedimenticola endophacoides]
MNQALKQIALGWLGHLRQFVTDPSQVERDTGVVRGVDVVGEIARGGERVGGPGVPLHQDPLFAGQPLLDQPLVEITEIGNGEKTPVHEDPP